MLSHTGQTQRLARAYAEEVASELSREEAEGQETRTGEVAQGRCGASSKKA